MHPSAALSKAKRLVREGKIALTIHVQDQMDARKVTHEELLQAVLTASHADVADRTNWKLKGKYNVTVIVALEDDCVYVTVWKNGVKL